MRSFKKFLFRAFKKTYAVLSHTGLRSIPGIWKLSNYFFRLIWPDESVIEVQGSKMLINVNDANPNMRKTFQAYCLNLIHEEATTALFKKVIKPGNVFLDLGTNIGYFTLLASRLVGEKGKVFSFEPEPTNFSYLKRNIALNNYNNVEINQKAVSNVNGKIKLFICPYDSGHHTINQSGGIKVYRDNVKENLKEIEVESITIDSFIKSRNTRVDVLKIDVEGAEVLAMQGMKEVLRENREIKMFLEFFPLLISEMGSEPSELVNILLKEHKFNMFVIGHDYSMIQSRDEYMRVKDYDHLNSLLKRKDDHLNLFLTRGDYIL